MNEECKNCYSRIYLISSEFIDSLKIKDSVLIGDELVTVIEINRVERWTDVE